MSDSSACKTIYVGNLEPTITEELLLALFGQLGPVQGCKLIRDNRFYEVYCFIEFANHLSALAAISAMDKRICLGRELKVNWAISGNGTNPNSTVNQFGQTKPDPSKPIFSVYVGDLSLEVSSECVKEAFSPFGVIADIKIVRDLVTGVSKGYGFVSYYSEEDAANAISSMNGQRLGDKIIRANWAARRPGQDSTNPYGVQIGKPVVVGTLNYDEIFNQASAYNTTVYCGGFPEIAGVSPVTVPDIKRKFSQYGRILDVRQFNEQGYAFIRFDSKESACQAIVSVHGSKINDQVVKCAWGKELPQEALPTPILVPPAGVPPFQTHQTMIPMSYDTVHPSYFDGSCPASYGPIPPCYSEADAGPNPPYGYSIQQQPQLPQQQ